MFITHGLLMNFIMLPLRLSWNIFIIALAVWLTVMWCAFTWGSVVVGVLLLIFFGVETFVVPMVLLMFTTELWPEYYKLIPAEE